MIMYDIYDVLAAIFWIVAIGGFIAYLIYFFRLPKEEQNYRIHEARKRKEQRDATKVAKGMTRRDIIKENRKNGIPMCPKCHSTSIIYMEKPGMTGVMMVDDNFGIAVPMGKSGYCKCLNCGKRWRI